MESVTHEPFEDKLRCVKVEQKKTEDDDRLKELLDQNAYLKEKLEFLNMQKTRNEQEIDRLRVTNVELKNLKANIHKQITSFLSVVEDWKKFREGVVNESCLWEQTSDTINATSLEVSDS